MNATLNGERSLPLPDGSELLADTDETMRRLTLRLECDAEVRWSSAPLHLSPDPTLSRSNSIAADYLAVAWPEAGVVVVLGGASAIAIDAASGIVRTTFALEFCGKTSLEQASLQLAAHRTLLVITSTKRVWVVGGDLEPLLRYEPRFILANSVRIEQRRLVVEEYDFDSDRDVVTEVIDL